MDGMKRDSLYYFNKAVEEAEAGMSSGHGGPFGAVIAGPDGEIIASAHNEVIHTHDPTAHAEILAIRRASEKLSRFDLSDCTIYSTCEPCPMCFSAIHWAKIRSLRYGCDHHDAARIGFDDKFIYDVIREETTVRQVEAVQEHREECLELFTAWENKEDKVPY